MTRRRRAAAFARIAAACIATTWFAAACRREAPTSSPTEDLPAAFSVRGRQASPLAMTYRVEVADGPLAAADFAAAIDRAAATLSATGCVRLVRVDDGQEAMIVLGFRRGRHGACEPFGQSHAYAHSGPVAVPTFVHFDAAREWSAGTGPGISLEAIALHELGHVLGLGHSSDPRSVMSSEPRDRERHLALSRADLAGLHSLYGGGPDEPGDLVVRTADGSERAVLRAVAPAATTGFCAFDLDGNGSDELCVHRTDLAGHGAMVGYGFDAAGRLERTFGPYAGLATPGARLVPARAANGARLLVAELPNGRRVAHRFDEHALAGPWLGLVPECAAPSEDVPVVADLDGDGVKETVERRVRRTDAR